MILYHITSLEKPIQSILIPKIPDETEIGENYTEKRICLAPSILECLKSCQELLCTGKGRGYRDQRSAADRRRERLAGQRA